MTARWRRLGRRTLVTIIPKNGSTSLFRTLKGPDLDYQQVSALKLEQNVNVIAFIREPTERLASAWRHFNAIQQWPTRNWEKLDYLTWELFIDGVLGGVNNHHWDPQVPQGMGLVDRWYPFDYFSRVLEPVLGRSPKHLNLSPKEWYDQDYRNGDILEFFSEDFTTYDNALGRQLDDSSL